MILFWIKLLKMQQNLGSEIRITIVKRNIFYYLQRTVFFALVLFQIVSVKHRIVVAGNDLFPWISLLLIILVLLTSYLFRKHDAIGELSVSNFALTWEWEKTNGEVIFSNETEVVFYYNSFAGEYSPLRIFLYGDKRADGVNNFLEINSNGERMKWRILINSEEEASMFISFFTTLRREQSLNVKIRNIMHWV